jgi:hypothetical protein
MGCNGATIEGDVELLRYGYEGPLAGWQDPESSIWAGVGFWLIVIFIILVISYPGLFFQILFQTDVGHWLLGSVFLLVAVFMAVSFIDRKRLEKMAAPDSPVERPTPSRMTHILRFVPTRAVSNFCYKCGRALEPTWTFCKGCGARVR